MTTRPPEGQADQFAVWHGQPVEIVGAAKNADGCPMVLLRFVDSDNKGIWAYSYASMDGDYKDAGPAARELLRISRQPAATDGGR